MLKRLGAVGDRVQTLADLENCLSNLEAPFFLQIPVCTRESDTQSRHARAGACVCGSGRTPYRVLQTECQAGDGLAPLTAKINSQQHSQGSVSSALSQFRATYAQLIRSTPRTGATYLRTYYKRQATQSIDERELRNFTFLCVHIKEAICEARAHIPLFPNE